MSFSLVTMETKMTFLPFFNDKNYKKPNTRVYFFFIFETEVLCSFKYIYRIWKQTQLNKPLIIQCVCCHGNMTACHIWQVACSVKFDCLSGCLN